MAVRIQIRRGLEADRLSVTPASGELLYATDTDLVYIGDGVTAGGILVGASDAASISYDNSTSGLTATNVQDAIDEVATTAGGAAGNDTELQFNDGGMLGAVSTLTVDKVNGTINIGTSSLEAAVRGLQYQRTDAFASDPGDSISTLMVRPTQNLTMASYSDFISAYEARQELTGSANLSGSTMIGYRLYSKYGGTGNIGTVAGFWGQVDIENNLVTISNLYGIYLQGVGSRANPTVTNSYTARFDEPLVGTNRGALWANGSSRFSGVMTNEDTTASTSATTGCATFAGGIGVAGPSVFDGTVSFQGGGSDPDSTIIGLNNTIGSYTQIMVIGGDNVAEGSDTIVIGWDNLEDTNSDDNIIIGRNNDIEDGGDNNVLIGQSIDARWGSRYGVALGHFAAVGNSSGGGLDEGDNSVAIGYNAKAEVNNSIAIGYFADVDGGTHSSGNTTQYGIAIGYQASVDDRGTDGIAIGRQSEADAENSIAIGRSAETDTWHDASIAIGAYARSTRANQLVFSSEFETDADETIREVAFNDPDDNPLGIRWPNPHYFEGPTFNMGRVRTPVETATFTSDGVTVTVTSTAHGLSTNDVIDVTVTEDWGAIDTGEKTITVTDPNTFTFAEAGSATAGATDMVYLPPRVTDVTYDGTTGVLSVLNDTDATSATSAPFVVAGGMGVSKDLILASGANVFSDPGLVLAQSGGTNFTGVYGSTTSLVLKVGNGLRYTFGNSLFTSGEPISVTDSTASTSTTTGALVVAGGVGIGGDVTVGGVVATGGGISIATTGDPWTLVPSTTDLELYYGTSQWLEFDVSDSRIELKNPYTLRLEELLQAENPDVAALVVKGGISCNKAFFLNDAIFSEGTDSPRSIAAGIGGIYYDASEDKWKINENGAGWVDLFTAPPAGVGDAALYADSSGTINRITFVATNYDQLVTANDPTSPTSSPNLVNINLNGDAGGLPAPYDESSGQIRMRTAWDDNLGGSGTEGVNIITVANGSGDYTYTIRDADSLTALLEIDEAGALYGGGQAIFQSSFTHTDGDPTPGPTQSLVYLENTGGSATNAVNNTLTVVTSGDSSALTVWDNSGGFLESKALIGMRHATLATSVSNGKIFAGGLTTENFGRFQFYSDGTYGIGPGSATRDVFLFRDGTNRFGIAGDAWTPSGSGGELRIYGTTASTSSSTGALIVDGGIGGSHAYLERGSDAISLFSKGQALFENHSNGDVIMAMKNNGTAGGGTLAWFGLSEGYVLGYTANGQPMSAPDSDDTILSIQARNGQTSIDIGSGADRTTRMSRDSGAIDAWVALGRAENQTSTARTLTRVVNRNPTGTLQLATGARIFEVISYDTTLSQTTDHLFVDSFGDTQTRGLRFTTVGAFGQIMVNGGTYTVDPTISIGDAADGRIFIDADEFAFRNVSAGTNHASFSTTAFTVNSGLDVIVQSTTASTTATNGALTVAGGVGIDGTLNADGTLRSFSDTGSAFGIQVDLQNGSYRTIIQNDGSNQGTQIEQPSGIIYGTGSGFGLTVPGDYYAFSRYSGTTWSELGRWEADGLTVAGYIKSSVQSVSASATIDSARVKFTGSTASQTLTLPAGTSGQNIMVRNAASVDVDVARAGADTIEGGTTFTLAPGEAIALTYVGTDWTVF